MGTDLEGKERKKERDERGYRENEPEGNYHLSYTIIDKVDEKSWICVALVEIQQSQIIQNL